MTDDTTHTQDGAEAAGADWLRTAPPKYRVERTDGTPVPADEPCFVIRAKDRFAVDVVRRYRALAAGAVSAEMLAELDAHLRRMTLWRNEHRDQIKTPD